jgi:hypothetical protein
MTDPMDTKIRALLVEVIDASPPVPEFESIDTGKAATMARSAVAARRRRRVRVGIASSAIVVVLGVLVGAVWMGSEDQTRVAVGPRQEQSRVPAGWTTLEFTSGLRLAVPAEWQRLTPYPPVPGSTAGSDPTEIAIVGSADLARTGWLAACTDELGAQVPNVLGTWLSLYEYPHGTPPGAVGVLDGSTMTTVDRPADFRTAPYAGGHCVASDTPSGTPEGSFATLAFTDSGRIFLARIVTTEPPLATGLELGFQVLNTLRVDPARASEDPALDSNAPTTMLAPATTYSPVPSLPKSFLIPMVTGLPRADAERAITALGCGVRVSFRDAPPAQEGTVLVQSPTAGERLICAGDVFVNITVGI